MIFPDFHLRIKIHIAFIFQQLIELPIIDEMGAFDLSIKSGRSWLYVDMIDS